MAEFVLIDGDVVNFLPAFTPAMVVVQPGRISGSGPATIGGKKICVEGDEKQVSVPGCMYTSGGFSIPGVGTLKIQALAPNQESIKVKIGGKTALLKGAQFTAVFEVQTPAQQPAPPAPPVPDPSPKYSGQGSFVSTDTKVSSV